MTSNDKGRFCLHLVEGKDPENAPFIFTVTYSWTDSDGMERHASVMEAAKNLEHGVLLEPLRALRGVAETHEWLGNLMKDGIDEPQAWNPDQAMDFIGESEKLKQAGVEIRVPDWSCSIPKTSAKMELGADQPSHVGCKALLNFKASVSMEKDETPLSDAEVERLVKADARLVLIRGKWVAPDREMLEQVAELRREYGESGIDMYKALRLMGDGTAGSPDDPLSKPDIEVEAAPWVGEWQKRLTSPEPVMRDRDDEHAGLQAVLRPYQQAGVQWMLDLQALGLGGILADDMGLGKTIQVLGLANCGSGSPILLIVPASLLGNWECETAKFAPGLRLKTAHSSAMDMKQLTAMDSEKAREWLGDCDIMLTTYGTAQRIPWLTDVVWRAVVLDEAQAVKNPGSGVSKFVRRLQAGHRLALTGTPIENRVNDLWALMDFANPGLLGTLEQFKESCQRMKHHEKGYEPLKQLLRPYLLRRAKTDKDVVPDLPDKTEMVVDCWLTRWQAALYQDAVAEMKRELARAKKTGIERHGIVLKYLTRFKQVCNHPANWSKSNDWDEAGSGKFARLRELAENIADCGEKMLVFSQYKYLVDPLAKFLEEVMQAPGLVLHGDTPVASRQQLVREFQEDAAKPFMVLSLKAGGTGLNLTAANHVVHFDRWWNPAVENQATDRAFRIGQHRNVLVHQFVVRGTLEERIDAMLRAKRQLSEDILGDGSELLLTGMDNEQLLELVSLDLERATAGI